MFDKASKRPRDRYEVTVWGKIVKTSLGAQNLHSAPSRRGTCSPGKSLCKELWIQKENFRKGRRDSRVSPAERAESIIFAAAKPWILSNVDLHCVPVSAAGLDEDLHEISHRYHPATAGTYDIQLSRSIPSGMWSLLTRGARMHAYYGISTTPIPSFSSKSKRQMQNAKSSSLPSIRYQICQIYRLSHAPRSKGPPPRILLFFYEQKIKIKNAHAIPRNMAILKSRSESSLSPPNGTIWGHLARCRLDAGGCCSLKFNLSSSFPSLLGAQRTSQVLAVGCRAYLQIDAPRFVAARARTRRKGYIKFPPRSWTPSWK
jgi:hypothetical protein